jgi:hypothetical protein
MAFSLGLARHDLRHPNDVPLDLACDLEFLVLVDGRVSRSPTSRRRFPISLGGSRRLADQPVGWQRPRVLVRPFNGRPEHHRLARLLAVIAAEHLRLAVARHQATHPRAPHQCQTVPFRPRSRPIRSDAGATSATYDPESSRRASSKLAFHGHSVSVRTSLQVRRNTRTFIVRPMRLP